MAKANYELSTLIGDLEYMLATERLTDRFLKEPENFASKDTYLNSIGLSALIKSGRFMSSLAHLIHEPNFCNG